MIIDGRLELADGQAIGNTSATTLADKSIDLGASRGDIGPGTPIPISISLGETVDGLATGGATFQVVIADDAAMTSNLTVILQSGAIPIASLVKGYKVAFNVLPDLLTKRYLSVQWVKTGTGNPTTGKVDAYVGDGKQTNKAGVP